MTKEALLTRHTPESLVKPRNSFLRLVLQDHNLVNTQEWLAMQDTINCINSVKNWAADRSKQPLPAEYSPDIDKQMVELKSETHAAIESLANLTHELNVYNNTGVAHLFRIAPPQIPESSNKPQLSRRGRIKQLAETVRHFFRNSGDRIYASQECATAVGQRGEAIAGQSAEFVDIPIKDLDGLRAFLGPGAGIYIHDIKNPFTVVWGYLQMMSKIKALYKTEAPLVNASIFAINKKIEEGAIALIADLQMEDKGIDLNILRKAYHLQIYAQIAYYNDRIKKQSNIVRNQEEIGSIEARAVDDQDISKTELVHGNNFWYRYLVNDIGKNVVNAFVARSSREREEKLGAPSKNETPDGVDYAAIPDDPEEADFSGIPEFLQDRSKRICVYRVCRSKDGKFLEVRVYDNATGFMKKIIDRGFWQSEKEGVHGYGTDEVHSQGFVMARHAELMNKFGIKITPEFVRDKEGRVVPKSGLTIIRMPLKTGESIK